MRRSNFQNQLETMAKETKDKHFIHKPTYSGGLKAMRAFIKNNLKYPKEALENKVEGTVYVDYKLDNKGNVIEAKVISGLGHGCDEEALRLVKMLKFEPARNRKLRITFNKKLQIHFRLPKEKPAAPISNNVGAYNYVITKAKPKIKADKKKKPQRKYTYTIPVSRIQY